jgi:hypothetical protein
MINDSSDKMMHGAPETKGTLFHFSGDGVYFPKAIIAASIAEAELIWHKTKIFILKQNSAPVASPPPAITAPPEKKVEDKPIDNDNE